MRPPDIEFDLVHQRLQAVELSFWPQVAHESDLDVFAINVAIKVEQVNFQYAFGFAAANRWAIPKIDDTVI